jgi:hypothetical protein
LFDGFNLSNTVDRALEIFGVKENKIKTVLGTQQTILLEDMFFNTEKSPFKMFNAETFAQNSFELAERTFFNQEIWKEEIQKIIQERKEFFDY